MASITIRHFEDSLKQKLRVQAALHGWSMEEEARTILRKALSEPQAGSASNMAQRIQQRFAAVGGVELAVETREPIRSPDNNEQ